MTKIDTLKLENAIRLLENLALEKLRESQDNAYTVDDDRKAYELGEKISDACYLIRKSLGVN